MDLFRIHTVPVPLDIDTYQGKESKYTTLELQYKYLATNGHEYMDVTDAALDSCNTYHMDHLCENLHVTTDVKELNCAIASTWTLLKHPHIQQNTYRTLLRQNVDSSTMKSYTPHPPHCKPRMKYCFQTSPVKIGS